jgi:hypothetical protein
MTSRSLPLESYQLTSRPASGSLLMNCHSEKLPDDAKTPFLIQRTPGISTLQAVGNGPIHGLDAALGGLGIVSGTNFYRISSALGSPTNYGSIGTIAATGIDMESNDRYTVIVNEPDGWAWDSTLGTLTQITDADFTSRGAGDVEFCGNWLLFREPNSGRMFGADLGSATSFDALNFVTAEASPDDMVGLKVDHGQPLLFGKKTVEIWDQTTDPGFPFARASNGLVEIGCLSGRSIQKQDNSVFWLANDYTIRRLDGATPVRVSHHGVEQSIVRATISACRSLAYSQGGHLFYVITFPEVTWVYDCTTQRWHNRSTYGYDYWTANCHAQAFDIEIVGSSETANIGKLDPDVFTEWGGTQRASWQYQSIYAEERRVIHDRLSVVMEYGVGLTTGQGSDPVLMMDYSDDGGITWDALPNKKIGPLGNYQYTVDWERIGSARQRAFRGAISDPVKVAITDTQWMGRGARF